MGSVLLESKILHRRNAEKHERPKEPILPNPIIPQKEIHLLYIFQTLIWRLVFAFLLSMPACKSEPPRPVAGSDVDAAAKRDSDNDCVSDTCITEDTDTDNDCPGDTCRDSDTGTDSDTSADSDTMPTANRCGLDLLDIDSSGSIADDCGLVGSWYWYADTEGTAMTFAEANTPPYRAGRGMCLSGTTIEDNTYAAWGAGVAFATEDTLEAGSPWNAAARGVVGLEVRVTGTTGASDLRMLVESAADRPEGVSPPFATLSGPGRHRVLFSDLRVPENWTPNGGEAVDPGAVRYISFNVAGGDANGAFEYCIEEVAPIVLDIIDDFEDGDDNITDSAGRFGPWYTYNDGTGNQSPTPPLGTVVENGEGNNGGYGAVTTGSDFTLWGAGMGFNLSTDGGMPDVYDASAHAGISVLLRGSSATGTVRILPVIRAVADPAYGGSCTGACDETHFWEVPLTDDWTRHALPFGEVFELGQHGAPFDPADLLGVNFQASEGGAFEVAVDDAAFYLSAASKAEPDPEIEIDLGPAEDLLLPNAHGLSAFPDQPLLELDLGFTKRYFITAWPNEGTAYPSAGVKMPTFALDAPNLDELADATPIEVLTPGEAGTFDNGYAGMAGIYRHSDGRLYGFYHGEDWEDTGLMPDTGDVEVAAFYAMVGAAVSDDDGLTWQKLGPVVSSNTTKDWMAYPEHADRGVCGPSVVVDTTGRYLYLYYTDNSRQNDRGVQISLARADISKGPPVPGAFEKYYLGTFGEPGLRGLESPLPGEDRMIYYPNLAYGHVVYSKYLERYVMVLNVDNWMEHTGSTPMPLAESGLGISFSQDGIYWSKPRILVTDYVAFRSGYSFSYMGQIIFDDDTGTSGRLVYGHSDNWGIGVGESMHHLVGHRISFLR